MATLILTALGTAVGGSIGALGAVGGALGGAFGALAGRAIDSRIFRPGARSGPRLSDLHVQTSRYGARVPRLYGTIRAAGTVIWSTDLQEASTTTGGGKGQPNVTRYSYAASFAVALSARRIVSIGRIWADGNLLRGTAGDFKSPVGAFRVYEGSEGQTVDPLIAADVGIDNAPAYRGCAYVVFEGLQLADFGNRIPSLTFEVFADVDEVPVSAIISDLAGQSVVYVGADSEPRLDGFAGDADDLHDATAALIAVHDLVWRERGGVVQLTAGISADRLLDAGGEIRAIDGNREPAGSKRRTPIEMTPSRLAIRHHDPERDYQIGIQVAERPGPGVKAADVDLPAVLSADEARLLADRRLRADLRGRTVVRRAMGWAALDLVEGDVVELNDEPGRWLIETTDWDDMAVRLTLRAIETGMRNAADAGASGAPVLQPDLVQGVTRVAIVELPPDGSTAATTPIVLVGATGDEAGWRRAALFRYRPIQDMAEPIGRTAPRAVLGTALTLLPDGAPWRIDRVSSVEVEIDNAVDALVAAPDDALLAGANLCQIGDEMLQFGEADLIAPRRYRLSRLIRGRFGVEWASASHAVGDRFVLVDADRLTVVPMAQGDIGQILDVRAIGSGDAVPAEAARLIEGWAMLPLSPVHGRIETLPTNNVAIRWIRRSRLGGDWASATESPLGEEMEAYVLRVSAEGSLLREWQVTTSEALYVAEDISADLAAAGAASLQIEIRQRGTWGLSRPLILPLP